jgi:hypothetical protein
MIGGQDRMLPLEDLTFGAVLFSTIGVIWALIAQFCGVLAFTQSSPNNADWATAAAGNSKDVNSNIAGFHGPWYGPMLESETRYLQLKQSRRQRMRRRQAELD